MLPTQDVHLLLFSEQGISFGVYAEQVKELLNIDPLFEDQCCDSELFIPYKGEELQIFVLSRRLSFHDILKENYKFLSCQERKLGEEAETVRQNGIDGLKPPSRILVVRHSQKGHVGVRVECLKQLRAVRLSQIFRLPVIMEKKKLFQSVWGLALIDERPVILVDLERI